VREHLDTGPPAVSHPAPNTGSDLTAADGKAAEFWLGSWLDSVKYSLLCSAGIRPRRLPAGRARSIVERHQGKRNPERTAPALD